MKLADNKRISAPGCVGLLLFFVIEVAAGFAVGYVAYLGIFGLFERLGWTGERDFAAVVAVCLAMLVALAPMVLIDRLCKRLTGHSVLDNLPVIP